MHDCRPETSKVQYSSIRNHEIGEVRSGTVEHRRVATIESSPVWDISCIMNDRVRMLINHS